jgi:DNA polymerase III delta prime subunit
VQTVPFGNFKVVLLDEADYMSPEGQAALRGIMETYVSTARFILTCNYPNKIIPALHSRCQGWHIDSVDHTEFTARVATILVTEDVQFDLDHLDSYVKSSFPDLRKCINLVEMNTIDSVLTPPGAITGDTADFKLAAVDLFKKKKFKEARKLICSQTRDDEIEGVFHWLVDNIEIFATEDEQQNKAERILRDSIARIPMMSHQEINLSVTIIDLCELQNG